MSFFTNCHNFDRICYSTRMISLWDVQRLKVTADLFSCEDCVHKCEKQDCHPTQLQPLALDWKEGS